MRARHAWWLVPVLAVAAWLWIRGRGDVPGHGPDARRVGATVAATALAASPDLPDRPSPGGRVPPPASGHGAASSAAIAAAAPVPSTSARPPAAARPTPALPVASPPPPRPAPPAPEDEAPAGRFNDKTGWGDHSVARQLNKEFMPLASECIGRAKDRKPFLTGLLSFTMVITPSGDGKAVVSALKVRPDNKIEDPELWECIRESSFALEGLTAPHDFDISMPITRDDAG